MRADFLVKIERYMHKQKMIEPHGNVLVALSGGADSVCLLRVLCELQDRFSLTIHAAHVNHMLRGADADADEAFCRALCEKLGVGISVLKKDVRQFAADTRQGTEAAARQVRYEFFETVKKQLGLDKIATAHNQNDQAETSLLYYLRGSGIDGIKGIVPVRKDGVIRPLLCVTRDEIEAYLSALGQDFVTDATNQAEDYTRNKIRHSLLPALAAEYNPNLVETLAQNASLLTLDAQYLAGRAQELYQTIATAGLDEVNLDVAGYRTADKALGLRAIRRAIGEVKGDERDISYDTVMRCDALFDENMQGKRVSVASGIFAQREYDAVRFFRVEVDSAGFCVPLCPGETKYIAQTGYYFSASIEDSGQIDKKRIGFQKNCEYFDYNSLSGQIYIRSRKNGDAFLPFGLQGEKKLKDYFIDEKVPAHLRAKVPLAVCGDEILWVCGYRRSGLHKVGAGTKQILKIEFWEGQETCKSMKM